MKRLSIFLLFPFILPAQTADLPLGVRLTPPANVPATVMDQFRTDFPKTTASWQRHGDMDWSAAFSDDSTQLPRIIVYEKSGVRIEDRRQMPKGAYPQAIDAFFHTHYPTVDYLVWLHQRDSSYRWFAVGPNDTVWFGRDGTFSGQLKSGGSDPQREKDADIIRSLWHLYQMRLAVLRIAEKNGFVTSTRIKHAEEVDATLRKLAAGSKITLLHQPDEGEQAHLTALSRLQGEKLTKAVNHDLQRSSIRINRQFVRASKSTNPALKELAEKHGGPEK